ncbi:Uncharacterised protein [Citrobacter koseri]|uniref:Uncharacterized protein n=1 Tax=Citrobacter koseri TaxID=545 RepID=A0A447UJ39_CITKO|nr:Uncharacterised protein [Citrobacter koseri]
MGHQMHTQQKVGWGRLSRLFYYHYPFFRHVREKYGMVASV